MLEFDGVGMAIVPNTGKTSPQSFSQSGATRAGRLQHVPSRAFLSSHTFVLRRYAYRA